MNLVWELPYSYSWVGQLQERTEQRYDTSASAQCSMGHAVPNVLLC